MAVTETTAVLTTAGLTAIVNQSGGPAFKPSYFKCGSSLITPTASMTDVTDQVYQGSDITYQATTDDTGNFICDVPASEGDFEIGNIGLFNSDDTMLLIASFPYQLEKVASSGTSIIGNTARFSVPMTASGISGIVDYSLVVASDAALPQVASESDLPAAVNATYPTYFVKTHSRIGTPALASVYNGYWWYAQLNFNIDDYGYTVLSTLIDDEVSALDAVTWSSSSSTWIQADGTDDDVGCLGVMGKHNDIIKNGLLTIVPATLTITGTGTATASLVVDSTGAITGYSDLVSDANFTDTPVLTVSGDGQGASLYATVEDGTVTDITIESGGSGYFSDQGWTAGSYYYANTDGTWTTTETDYYLGVALTSNSIYLTVNNKPLMWKEVLEEAEAYSDANLEKAYAYTQDLVATGLTIDVSSSDGTITESSTLSEDTSRYRDVVVTGSGVSSRTLNIPSSSMTRRIYNESSALLTVSNGSSTVSIASGDMVTVRQDSDNGIYKWEKKYPHGSLASASTCDIGSSPYPFIEITGTTTIDSFGSGTNYFKILKFSEALTLSYSTSAILLPGEDDYAVSANDIALVSADSSGVATVMLFTGDGYPVIERATTRDSTDSSTLIATTAFVQAVVAAAIADISIDNFGYDLTFPGPGFWYHKTNYFMIQWTQVSVDDDGTATASFTKQFTDTNFLVLTCVVSGTNSRSETIMGSWGTPASTTSATIAFEDTLSSSADGYVESATITVVAFGLIDSDDIDDDD